MTLCFKLRIIKVIIMEGELVLWRKRYQKGHRFMVSVALIEILVVYRHKLIINLEACENGNLTVLNKFKCLFNYLLRTFWRIPAVPPSYERKTNQNHPLAILSSGHLYCPSIWCRGKQVMEKKHNFQICPFSKIYSPFRNW